MVLICDSDGLVRNRCRLVVRAVDIVVCEMMWWLKDGLYRYRKKVGGIKEAEKCPRDDFHSIDFQLSCFLHASDSKAAGKGQRSHVTVRSKNKCEESETAVSWAPPSS